MSPSMYLLHFCAATLISFLCFCCWQMMFNAKRLPPGPKGLPVIGIAQLPKDHLEKTFHEWGQRFGDLVYARMLRTPTIIINSAQVAKDLLEKCGGNYSNRPRLVLINELMGLDGILPFIPYGPRFRKVRAWFQTAFHPQVALKYRPFQFRETHIVLKGLISKPDEYCHHFERFGAAVLMEVTYGHRVVTDDDPYVQIARDTLMGISTAESIGDRLVELFPALKYYPTWMPGAGFRKHAQKIQNSGRTMLDVPFNIVKQKMETTGAQSCFTGDLLEECLRKGPLTVQDERDIKGTAVAFYAGGAETMTAILTSFILAMVKHPNVYKKAKEEMDRVVGSDRLPDFGDRASLPYLNCIIKETYRWNPPAPLGLPHAALQDGEYCGYHIPARSIVIPNIWAMSRNEHIYSNSEMFSPERFLGTTNEDLMDPKNIVFGFGRRICPGRDFADSNVYLLISNIVATMDLLRARDAKGNEIDPPVEFRSGLLSIPEPFKCVIRPRSSQVAAYIRGLDVDD